MLRPSAMFFLPNTTTLLARTAINLLRSANQEVLDEAIQTLVNRRLAADGVMAYLEQNVHIAEVLEKLARDWGPETIRVFANALQMEPVKTDVMDLIVAIAILNEPDLEAELRGENTTDATGADLLENRRITWQYPPAGTPLTPPYIVLVAVEQIDTSAAQSEVQAILGELVDYKGYKIARRLPIGVRPGLGGIRIRPEILTALATGIGDAAPPAAPPAPPIAPVTPFNGGVTAPFAGLSGIMGALGQPASTPLAAPPAAPASGPTRAAAVADVTRMSSLLSRSSRLGVM